MTEQRKGTLKKARNKAVTSVRIVSCSRNRPFLLSLSCSAKQVVFNLTVWIKTAESRSTLKEAGNKAVTPVSGVNYNSNEFLSPTCSVF